ncbi:MAG: transporter substrate-binding domain-containing protein [Fibrobacter sp.]|nr:transporter substrate-binding domain-containing protein [Fibrobacteraceae bacterium]MCF0222733.1 transporter substrate-binding domain-containing protein [Fibrobacter sp.]
MQRKKAFFVGIGATVAVASFLGWFANTDKLSAKPDIKVGGVQNWPDRISSKTIDDLDRPGVTMAVLNGTYTHWYMQVNYPKADVKVFENFPDMIDAVESGAVEFCALYDNIADKSFSVHSKFNFVNEVFTTEFVYIGFAKSELGAVLQKEYNAFIEKIKANGEYDRLLTKWNSPDFEKSKIDNYQFTGKRGVIKMASTAAWPSRASFREGAVVGLLVDLAYYFCQEYDYQPTDIEIVNFAEGLAAAEEKRYDMFVDAITETPENKERFYFSNPYHKSETVMITKNF